MSDPRKLSPDITGDQDVPVAEDLTFQRREWQVQRAAWLVMTAIVVAALLGLTGVGPLAYVSASTADDALQLTYSRLGRIQSPGDLQIDVATSGADRVALWLTNDFLETIEIERITPAPVETRTGSDRQIFVFAVDPMDPVAPIWISYRHDAIGIISGTVGVVDGPELGFGQFVYP